MVALCKLLQIYITFAADFEVEPKLFLWYSEMKKHLVTAAMMLLCFPAFSQEANEPGRGAAELTAIARAEYPLGNTSLYTLLEGNLTENLSYCVENHWLSTEPGLLYQNTLRSDDVNWLDFAYLTYSFDSFEISAGKDMLPWGTFEMDEYDFDIHLPFVSSVWNMLPIYQWGLKASWLPTDELCFDVRVSTSPYGERPFASGLYAAGVRGRFTTETTDVMAAFNAMQTEPGNMIGALSLGVRQGIGNCTATLDFNSRPGDEEFILGKGYALAFTFDANINDVVNLRTAVNYEQYDNLGLCSTRLGEIVEWYPLDCLRVHAVAGYGLGFEQGFLYSVGLTYKFSTGW